MGDECQATAVLAYAVTSKVHDAMQKAGKQSAFKLFLTGYSRGGAIVIAVARILQLKLPDVRVECMALFDAVDRSALDNVDTVPGNVKTCYHALRNPSVDSRSYFGNCGLNIEHPGKLVKKTFFSTHAGMGGMPWTGDFPVKQVANPKFDLSTYAKKNPMMFAKAGYPPEASKTVPTITEAEDKAGSTQVRLWMWANMKKHGMVY